MIFKLKKQIVWTEDGKGFTFVFKYYYLDNDRSMVNRVRDRFGEQEKGERAIAMGVKLHNWCLNDNKRSKML